ncbi:uncharacterized protein LOC141899118 [Tubulanus polymorphus]|uniref:uncharacterized protein LOC141899118 n=1 Tax=Tubulanus polymorphus TaxID=672921 RepID=UPI003DA1F0B7
MGKKIQFLGRYVMEGQTLGKGNFARVELATHGVTNCKVAIKIIDSRKIKEDYVRVNLHREGKILAQLRHPNIIRLYEALKANTNLYCLVTEYAAGGELLTFLKTFKDQRLTETQARPFIRQLISSLHYLHERGIVHRDLKMENIMLDSSKKSIKLIDFGLSNSYTKEELLKTHCGSPEYAAPELFDTGKEYGSEIDMWSVGVIMYALVVGKLPFTTPYTDQYRRQKLIQQIQKGLTPKHEKEMTGLSQACKNLITRLIEANPEQRIPLREVETHPWITCGGKLPFYPYLPPHKDKASRSQIVEELATLLDVDRKQVEKTVHEYRSDELSAMYNMMMEQKRKEAGIFDVDHTSKPFRVRNPKDIAKEPSCSKSSCSPQSKKGTPGKKSTVTKDSKTKDGKSPKARPKLADIVDRTTQLKKISDLSAKNANKDAGSSGIAKGVGACQPQQTLTSDIQIHTNSQENRTSTSSDNPQTNKQNIVDNYVQTSARLRAQVTVAKVRQILEAELSQSDNSSHENLTGATSSPAPDSATSPVVLPLPGAKKLKRPQRLNVPNLELTPVTISSSAQSSRSSHTVANYIETSLSVAATVRPRVASPSKIPGPSPLRETAIVRTPSWTKNSFERRRPKSSGARLQTRIPSPIKPVRSPFNAMNFSDKQSRTSRLVEIARARGAIPKYLDYTKAPRALPEDSSSSSDPSIEDTMQHTTMPQLPGDTKYDGKQHLACVPKICEYTFSSDVDTSEAELEPRSVSESKPRFIDKINLDVYQGSSTSDVSQSGSGILSNRKMPRPMANILSTFYHRWEGSRSGSDREDGSGSNPSSTSKLVSNKRTEKSEKQKLKPSKPSRLFLRLDSRASNRGNQMQRTNSSKSNSKRTPSPQQQKGRIVPPKPHPARKPMQTPIATIESFTDDEDDDVMCQRPLITCGSRSSSPCSPHRLSHSSIHRSHEDNSTNSAKQSNKECFPKNGVFTPVPDQTLRLQPAGHGSYDSLTHESSVSSRQGEGSTDRLMTAASGCGSKVHPVDNDDETNSSLQTSQSQNHPVIKSNQSRIPRPSTGNATNVHGFTSLSPTPAQEGSNGLKSPERKKKKVPPRLTLLKEYDPKSKQSTWKHGLSHLLRRTKPGGINNNVMLRQGGGSTTYNSATHRSTNRKPREQSDLDNKWSANSPAASSSCPNKYSNLRVSPSPVPQNHSPTPNPPQIFDFSNTHCDTPHSPQKKKKSVWPGCKECAARSDQSSDEVRLAKLSNCEHGHSGPPNPTPSPIHNENVTSPRKSLHFPDGQRTADMRRKGQDTAYTLERNVTDAINSSMNITNLNDARHYAIQKCNTTKT